MDRKLLDAPAEGYGEIRLRFEESPEDSGVYCSVPLSAAMEKLIEPSDACTAAVLTSCLNQSNRICRICRLMYDVHVGVINM